MSGGMGGDPGGRVLGRAPSITVGLAEANLAWRLPRLRKVGIIACRWQVEEQEKLFLHVKSLNSWPGKMKFVILEYVDWRITISMPNWPQLGRL